MITPIYASLVAMIYLFMTFKVIVHRRTNRISLGDDGDKHFQRVIRGHANLTETAPISLLLILMLDLQTEGAIIVHILGTMLVLGRIIHAYAFLQKSEALPARTAGMVLTLSSILIGLISNLVVALT